MRSTSSGRNGTVSLIRDWNVCRYILWMCKDTGVLRGVLLIKGYPPPQPCSPHLHDTSPQPPFSFSALSCCQVLLRHVRLVNETPPTPFPILYLFCTETPTLKSDSRPIFVQSSLKMKHQITGLAKGDWWKMKCENHELLMVALWQPTWTGESLRLLASNFSLIIWTMRHWWPLGNSAAAMSSLYLPEHVKGHVKSQRRYFTTQSALTK